MSVCSLERKYSVQKLDKYKGSWNMLLRHYDFCSYLAQHTSEVFRRNSNNRIFARQVEMTYGLLHARYSCKADFHM